MYGYEIFHDSIMLTLIDAVRRGDSAHAYIFEGAHGMRTRECAELLAAALTCTAGRLAPCGTCVSCVTAAAKTNPDIIYIDKKDKKSIGVETVRALMQEAVVKPFESRHKVYIIEDAELMTEAAQNALLKTLEEPPSFVTFLLLAQDSTPLLPTVLSRCVLIKFPPVGEEQLRSYIKKHYPEETRVDFLCKYAQGNPGAIDAAVADNSFEALRTSSLQMLKPLLSSHYLDAYVVADYMKENADRSDDILDFWLDELRDILLCQQSGSALMINDDFKEQLQNYAQRLDEAFVIRAVEKLIEAKQMSRRYVNLRAMTLWLCFQIKMQKSR